MKMTQLFASLFAVIVFAGCMSCQAEDKLAKLAIVKAEYGDLPTGNKTDVTDKVKGLVNADGLSVEATNENFGDPADGVTKKLKVEYTLDDKKLDQQVNEGESLKISLKPVKLKIVKAFYGDIPDGTKTDVTDKVQSAVKDNALSIGASNENFGDPVEGTVKKLKVDYTFDGGAAKSKEANENDTLTISDKGE